MEEEIFKHIKKRDSDKSKSKRKSKHKHVYDTALVKIADDNKYVGGVVYVGKYCVVCGKIDNLFYDTVKTEDGFRRMLDKEEILEKYKDKPHFEIRDFWDKYVALSYTAF